MIHREHDGNNKNIIHEFLVDYQCEQPVDKDGKPTNLKVNKPCEENSEGYDAGNGWFVQIQIDPKEQSDNIQVITHSVLEEYENKENGFNCTGSTVKPEKNTDPPYDPDSNGFYKYDGNKEDADHKYSFTIDFTKPIEYQYKNEDTSFGLRNINEIEYGNQRVPKIAMNRKTGEFVAVWEDDSDPSDGTSEYDWTLYVNTGASMMKNINNYDIKARRFCASGCVESSDIIVSEQGGQQRNPDVAMDEKGNYVVVWEDDQDSNGYTEGFMRGFDSRGHRLFSRKFHDESGGQQFLPHISMNSKGQFVVVWYSFGTMYSGTEKQKLSVELLFSSFKADGTPVQMEQSIISFGESKDALGVDRALDVAMAEDGSFVVIWRANDNSIYAKSFDADGKVKSYDAAVSGYDSETKVLRINATRDKAIHYQPSIGMNPQGDYAITYVECLQTCSTDDPSNCTIDHCQIMARWFDKAGKENISERVISEKDKIDRASNPTVCMDDKGNAVFGWRALTISPYDKYTVKEKDEQGNVVEVKKSFELGDIRRARLDSQGKLIGTIDTIHHNTVGDQAYPAVACTSEGNHVFVFTDDVDEDDETEIMGRGYDVK